MLDLAKRKSVDLLVEQFWKNGYLTISRRYGTYLPEPAKIGGFDVDIVAKQRSSYAIGITLNHDDLQNPKLLEKLNFLATRRTKFSNKKVYLFVGVPSDSFDKAKALINVLNEDIKKNIKIFRIVEKTLPKMRQRNSKESYLFS